ncbi:hypothetical protein [Sinorhizobium fredii]
MADIPAEVLTAIKAAAKKSWSDDRQMQDYYMESECDSYLAIVEMDFGDALPFRDQIIARAGEFSDLWEDRATYVRDEVDGYAELQNHPADVPGEVLDELKRKAIAEHYDFSSQGDALREGIRHFRYVRDTRAKIAPIRDLLVRMENIIGEECYNDNIQNYSSWGVWEGEGRSFRYPVTVLRGGKAEKRKFRFDDLLAEELVTGHYKFGANELSIYRALIKIVDMLETEYGLNVPRS